MNNMLHHTYYKQCKLLKFLQKGTTEKLIWVPEQLAVVSNLVKLKDPETQRDHHWLIETVYDIPLYSISYPEDNCNESVII
jgi:hypothetical protein